MAQVLLQLTNVSYGDRMVVDSKDAQIILDIVSRSKAVKDVYDSGIFVYQDPVEATIRTANRVELMTEEEYALHKEAKKAFAEAQEAKKAAETNAE